MEISIALFLSAYGWVIVSEITSYEDGIAKFIGEIVGGSGRSHKFVAHLDDLKIVHSHV